MNRYLINRWNGSPAFLPAIVFGAGCLFLVMLLSTIKPAVFFSGDGGLKYLVAQQVNKQEGAVKLKLAANDWVNDIWQKGFYPFKPPFVYDQQGGKTVSFPPYFQWLSAPVLRVFGWAGLYWIPAISLLLLWVYFVMLLYRLRLAHTAVASALFGLCFCSPLSFYGAVYWEHTLAVLLFFAGIAFLVKPPDNRIHAFAAGSLTGLAAWFRPEALLLWLLIVAMVLYNQVQQPKKTNLYFVTGSFLFVILFFFCNKWMYGNFPGAHSYQLTDKSSFNSRFMQSVILMIHLNAKQLLFFPVMILVYAMVLYALIKKYTVPKQVLQLLLLSLLFSLIAPFFLPNGGGKQWGPRYFLFLIPVLLVAGAHLFNLFPIKKTLLWLVLPVVIYSISLNGLSAYKTLREDYSFRVNPCLQLLLHDSCKIVIVQNQFVAQEFASLFHAKNIFLAENSAQYVSLQTLLLNAGKKEWIFLARDRELVLPCHMQQRTADIRHAGDYFFVRCHQ